MRYWLFENKEIIGPYNPDELSRLPHYSPKSLVCPEDRRGQDTRDWNWAEKFPELSPSLVKAHPAGPGVNRYGGVTTETTIKDLRSLGEVQDKMEAMERAVSNLQGSLKAKEQDLLDLQSQVQERYRSEAALQSRCDELERRLLEVATLRPALDQAVAAEQNVESVVALQRQEILDLGAELARLRDELRGLEEQLRPKPTPPPLPLAPPAPAQARLEPPPLPVVAEEPAPEPEAPPKPQAAKFKAAVIGAAIGTAGLLAWFMLRTSRHSKAPPPATAAAPAAPVEAKIETKPPQPAKPKASPAPIPPPLPAKPSVRKVKIRPKSAPIFAKPRSGEPPPPSLTSETDSSPEAPKPAAEKGSEDWPKWNPADAPPQKPEPAKLMLPGMEKKPAEKETPTAPPPAGRNSAPKKISEEELLNSLLQR